MNNQQKLDAFFAKFNTRIEQAPSIIAEEATEYFKERFTEKSWNNVPWKPTKKPVNKGSLMVRSGELMGSIKPTLVTPSRVTISAGSSKVPYAKVHNEGGTINRKPRSETFQRNKDILPSGMWRFKKGTTKGKGFTFKASSFNMPKRQFMGLNNQLRNRIIKRIIKSITNP